ncbi:S15 peptidase family protein [Mycolicibacterium sp. XJ1819]
MASQRIGGLAVALGIGSAVVVGHGVASADSTDGSTGPSSPDSSASASTADGGADTTAESTPPAGSSPSDPVDADISDAETADAPKGLGVDDPPGDNDSFTRKKRLNGSDELRRSIGEPGETSVVTTQSTPIDEPDAPAAVLDDFPPAEELAELTVEAVGTTTQPLRTVEPPEDAPPPEPTEAAVVLTKAVSALLDPFAGDAPATPMASPAMWTMAAAARRELLAPAPNLDQPADPVTTSLTTLAEEPAVVAIEQTAPLAWLQQLPILGPLAVTPLVVVVHQIPVIGDILHPFVGYPVQQSLAAGAPAPRDVKVISFDGTPIYVHFMPARGLAAGQTAPTVLNGPGLGMPGSTSLDGTILDAVLVDALGLMSVGVLRDAGYNVATWDPRGEYSSGGRLELNAAEFEARDMSVIIDWLATLPEVGLDAPGDPRLGMTGVSYGGGIQLVTAANDTRVDAIVPAITYHSFTNSLYEAEAFKNSWATLLTGVLGVTMARTNPRILPAAIIGALTGRMLPEDQALLESRNPVIGDITVPTLLIQGTADTIFTPEEADQTAQILIANGVPTKVVWFCGGHGFCANRPADLLDGVVITQRTLQWLDRYVKGLDVPTGPQFEWVDQRGQWFSSDTYPVAQGSPVVASRTVGATLPLLPYFGGSGIPFVPFALQAPIAVNLRVPAADETRYLVGTPELTLTYSGTGSSRHVYAQLVDNTTGLVVGSFATPIPVTLDGNTHTVTVPLEPLAHTLRPGETITLQLVASAGLYERILPSLGLLEVSEMQLSLPTAEAVTLSVSPQSTTAA